jgi:hypothetical protein
LLGSERLVEGPVDVEQVVDVDARILLHGPGQLAQAVVDDRTVRAGKLVGHPVVEAFGVGPVRRLDGGKARTEIDGPGSRSERAGLDAWNHLALQDLRTVSPKDQYRLNRGDPCCRLVTVRCQPDGLYKMTTFLSTKDNSHELQW